VGPKNCADYGVSVDVLIEEFGSVTSWGRVDHLIPCMEEQFHCVSTQRVPHGHLLNVDSEGRWRVNKTLDNGATVTHIQSGFLTSCPPKAWRNLKLAFRGSSINVLIDRKPVVVNYSDSGRAHAYGMVAFETEWNRVQFDNFWVGLICP
jgi:hypothetical protein